MDRFADIQQRLSVGLSTLVERLPAILASPRAYPKEAMLLATIAALVLVLVVLAIIVAIELFRSSRDRRRMGVVRSGRRLRLLYVIAAVLPLSMMLVLAPNLLIVNETCDSCHQITPAVEAWRVDAHASVSCYGCHSQGGLFGSAQAGAQGVIRLVGGVSANGVAPPVVYENRCLDCHEDIADGVLDGEVRMRHSDVVEAGLSCSECHAGVGHELMERDGQSIDRSVMAACLGCHDGVEVSSDCALCHLHRPSDRTDGIKSASTPAPVTCAGCHAPETEKNCIDCHGLELPHPQAFFGEHAGLSWNDPGLCASCHEAASPSDGCSCHTDINVHGTYTEWFPQHGPSARLIWPGGCNCHDVGFCGFCHTTLPL